MIGELPRTAGVLLATLALLLAGCREESAASGTPASAPSASDTSQGDAAVADNQPAIFKEVTESVGIDFVHEPGPFGSYFLPEISGTGAAMLDFDADGDLDLFFVNGTLRSDSAGAGGEQSAAAAMTNRLYRQEADGHFTDVTQGSGLEDPSVFGMGVAVGDVNNDGLPDVYLTNYGPDRLLLNTGEGVFVDITKEAGIDNPRWSSAAIFFDYDRDGWLDLFVANYLDYVPGRTCIKKGSEDYCGSFPGTPDNLYRNLGGSNLDGRGEGNSTVGFEDASRSSGIAGKLGAGLGVACTDFNNDGRPDIYVANDGYANFLWISQPDGTFRDEAILMGVAYDSVGRGQASMGVAMPELNGDRQPDLVVTHLAGETNAVYVSDENHYEEQSVQTGIAAASVPCTGWGVVLVDLDHDGDLDLAVANGRIARREKDAGSRSESDGRESNPWSPYFEPNQLLINDGSGAYQSLASREDAFLERDEMSRALVAGDVDNDGDVDLLVTNIAGRGRLFLNEAAKAGSWLSIRAVDPRYGNRDAYGAWIEIHAGGQRWRQHLNPSSSYLSSHDPRVHFGLGKVDAIDHIDVEWPDGLTERFGGGPVNNFRVLSRGAGESL